MKRDPGLETHRKKLQIPSHKTGLPIGGQLVEEFSAYGSQVLSRLVRTCICTMADDPASRPKTEVFPQLRAKAIEALPGPLI